MAVILHRDNYDQWLDLGFTDVTAVSEMPRHYDARMMRCFPVSAMINHVRNDDAECVRPVEIHAPPQGQLFV